MSPSLVTAKRDYSASFKAAVGLQSLVPLHSLSMQEFEPFYRSKINLPLCSILSVDKFLGRVVHLEAREFEEAQSAQAEYRTPLDEDATKPIRESLCLYCLIKLIWNGGPGSREQYSRLDLPCRRDRIQDLEIL